MLYSSNSETALQSTISNRDSKIQETASSSYTSVRTLELFHPSNNSSLPQAREAGSQQAANRLGVLSGELAEVTFPSPGDGALSLVRLENAFGAAPRNLPTIRRFIPYINESVPASNNPQSASVFSRVATIVSCRRRMLPLVEEDGGVRLAGGPVDEATECDDEDSALERLPPPYQRF